MSPPPKQPSAASPPGGRHQRTGEAGSALARDASPSSAESLLRRLEWTVIRRLDGLLHGDYRTLFRGSGLDLADLDPSCCDTSALLVERDIGDHRMLRP